MQYHKGAFIDLVQIVKSLVISVAIAFLIPIAIHYGIEIVSPGPSYSSYMHDKKDVEPTIAQAEYDVALKEYQFNHFVVNVIIGAALILLGYFIHVGFLGAGFILGGVFCLMVGSAFYWHKFSVILKFGAIMSTIILLIVIAYLIGKLTKR